MVAHKPIVFERTDWRTTKAVCSCWDPLPPGFDSNSFKKQGEKLVDVFQKHKIERLNGAEEDFPDCEGGSRSRGVGVVRLQDASLGFPKGMPELISTGRLSRCTICSDETNEDAAK